MNSNKLISFNDTSVAFSSRPDKELKKMYFLFSIMNLDKLTKIGTYFVKFAIKAGLPVKNVIKSTLFNHFCGGETIQECIPAIKNLGKYKIGAILDYSVEGAGSETAFDETYKMLIKAIDYAAANVNIPFVVFKMTGLSSADLLQKIQKREKLVGAETVKFDRLKFRIKSLCSHAFENHVKLMVDAEESWIQDIIDELVIGLMKEYNREDVMVYNTFQMYRKGMLNRLQKLSELATQEGFKIGVKLVRGAYLEKEHEVAASKGIETPVYSEKKDTDNSFNEGLKFCLKNIKHIALCSGSHNEDSNLLQIEIMQQFSIPANDPRCYFAQLYGMGDHISYNLANEGYNVAKYLPFGPVKEVMPYLFRRAEENKSIAGQTSRELDLIKREIKRRRLKR
ncbi:MAG: proline dehydrogenase family protein [Cytophagaceae bacterium]